MREDSATGQPHRLDALTGVDVDDVAHSNAQPVDRLRPQDDLVDTGGGTAVNDANRDCTLDGLEIECWHGHTVDGDVAVVARSDAPNLRVRVEALDDPCHRGRAELGVDHPVPPLAVAARGVEERHEARRERERGKDGCDRQRDGDEVLRTEPRGSPSEDGEPHALDCGRRKATRRCCAGDARQLVAFRSTTQVEERAGQCAEGCQYDDHRSADREHCDVDVEPWIGLGHPGHADREPARQSDCEEHGARGSESAHHSGAGCDQRHAVDRA